MPIDILLLLVSLLVTLSLVSLSIENTTNKFASVCELVVVSFSVYVKPSVVL